MRSPLLLGQHLRNARRRGPPAWVDSRLRLDLDFVRRRAWIEPTVGQGVVYDYAGMLEQIDYDRDYGATHWDSTGTLVDVGTDELRLNHDPVSLDPLGALIESYRPNAVPANTMTGAVAGTPGTLPTGFSIPSLAGLTRSVVGFGTEKGIDYIDIRFQGVPNSTSALVIYADAGETISSGASWATFGWFKLVAGGLTNVSAFTLRLANEGGGTEFTPGATLTRVTNARTATGTTARWALRWNYGDTVTAVDFTLRIGQPQREPGGFASSPIRTAGSSAGRSGDALSIPLGDWYNPEQGTWIVDFNVNEATSSVWYSRVLQVDDGGFNNCLAMVFETSYRRLYATAFNGGSPQLDIGASGLDPTAVHRMAFAYKDNDFAAAIDGTFVDTDNAGTVPTGLTTARFGCEPGGYGNLFGHIRRVRYADQRLGDGELPAL